MAAQYSQPRADRQTGTWLVFAGREERGESWSPSQFDSTGQTPHTVSLTRGWRKSRYFSCWEEPSLRRDSSKPSLMIVVRLFEIEKKLNRKKLFQAHCWIFPLHYRAQWKWQRLSIGLLEDMCWERLLIVGSRELDINLDLLRGGGIGLLALLRYLLRGYLVHWSFYLHHQSLLLRIII